MPDGPMTGETDEARSSWTVDTLHAHVHAQLDDAKELLKERHEAHVSLLDERFAGQTQATKLAVDTINERLAAMNEFRSTITDQQSTFLSREVADAKFDDLEKQIGALTLRVGNMAALNTQAQRNLTVGLAIATIILTIIIFAANYAFGTR